MTLPNYDHPLAFFDGHPMPFGGVCIIAALWGLEDTDDRPTRLIVHGRDTPWMVDVPANVIAITAIVERGAETLVALSRDGRVFIISMADERVLSEIIRHKDFGNMTGLHAVGAHVLAYGTSGQVYARHGQGQWEPFSEGLFTSVPTVHSPHITDMSGLAFDSLYAVGLFGLLARCNAQRWTRIDCPTNVTLNQAVQNNTGHVLACGDRGVLVRGAGDQWEAIDTGVQDGFWGVAVFHDTIYLSTLEGLWCFDEKVGAAPIDTGLDSAPTTYRLATDETALWSIGISDVLRFDGERWQRVLSPEGSGR